MRSRGCWNIAAWTRSWLSATACDNHGACYSGVGHERLSEYRVKGFKMDDQRLKNPPARGSDVPDYFDKLLERIRDLRASEKRMYLRVRETLVLAWPDRWTSAWR